MIRLLEPVSKIQALLLRVLSVQNFQRSLHKSFAIAIASAFTKHERVRVG